MKINEKILKGLLESKIGPISAIKNNIRINETNKAISKIKTEIKNAEKVYKVILDSEPDNRKSKIKDLYKIYYNIFDIAMNNRVFLKFGHNGKIINKNKKDTRLISKVDGEQVKAFSNKSSRSIIFGFDDISDIDIVEKDGMSYLYLEILDVHYL